MNKIIRPGSVKYDWYYNGNRRVDVFMEIKYNDGRLSICGVIGPNHYGNCVGGCGQIVMSFKDGSDKLTEYAPGWNQRKFEKFLDIWDKWHLNDLRAGTRKQEDYLESIANEFPGYPTSHYTWAIAELTLVGLNPDPDNGYNYGSAWLTEEIPQDIIDWLFSLPDADKTPAWV